MASSAAEVFYPEKAPMTDMGLKSLFSFRNLAVASLISAGLHLSFVAIMGWRDEPEPVAVVMQPSKIRIFANPNGNPNAKPTKAVEVAKPKPKATPKPNQRSIVAPNDKNEPVAEVANDLPQSFGDDVTGGVIGVGKSTGDGTESGLNSDLEPIDRINPIMPDEAREKGIEGNVRVRFDITEDGKIENFQVIEAEPRRIFDKAVREAVRKWKYAPRVVQGNPVRVVGVEKVFVFSLNE